MSKKVKTGAKKARGEDNEARTAKETSKVARQLGKGFGKRRQGQTQSKRGQNGNSTALQARDKSAKRQLQLRRRGKRQTATKDNGTTLPARRTNGEAQRQESESERPNRREMPAMQATASAVQSTGSHPSGEMGFSVNKRFRFGPSPCRLPNLPPNGKELRAKRLCRNAMRRTKRREARTKPTSRIARQA